MTEHIDCNSLVFRRVRNEGEIFLIDQHILRTSSQQSMNTASVADPGCLSRIPDPTFLHPGFRIPDPGSELSPSRIPDPHQRI